VPGRAARGRRLVTLNDHRALVAAAASSAGRATTSASGGLWPIDAGEPPEDFIFCSSEMTPSWRALGGGGMSITVLLTANREPARRWWRA